MLTQLKNHIAQMLHKLLYAFINFTALGIFFALQMGTVFLFSTMINYESIQHVDLFLVMFASFLVSVFNLTALRWFYLSSDVILRDIFLFIYGVFGVSVVFLGIAQIMALVEVFLNLALYLRLIGYLALVYMLIGVAFTTPFTWFKIATMDTKKFLIEFGLISS